MSPSTVPPGRPAKARENATAPQELSRSAALLLLKAVALEEIERLRGSAGPDDPRYLLHSVINRLQQLGAILDPRSAIDTQGLMDALGISSLAQLARQAAAAQTDLDVDQLAELVVRDLFAAALVQGGIEWVVLAGDQIVATAKDREAALARYYALSGKSDNPESLRIVGPGEATVRGVVPTRRPSRRRRRERRT